MSLRLGWMTSVAALGIAAPTLVTRLASTISAPGNGGTTTTTSAGSAVTINVDLTNDSGATMTIATLVLQGWYATLTGTTACGNNYDLSSVTIESPTGTQRGQFQVSGSNTITVVNNSEVTTDACTLSASIASGASYRIKLTGTVANGQKYITTGFGLAGVMTTALSNTIRKPLYGLGTSIEVNDATFTSKVTPIYACSNVGQQVQPWTVGSAFDRHAALSLALGCNVYIPAATNDMSVGGRSAATITGYFTSLKAKLAASQKLYAGTVTPFTAAFTVPVTTLTSSGTTATFTLGGSPGVNVLLLPLNSGFTVSGATGGTTGYNTQYWVSGNDGVSTITATVVSGLTTPATGTIIIKAWQDYASPYLQAPTSVYPGVYAAGTGSVLGAYNTTVRGGSAPFTDGFCENADAMMTGRDTAIWVQGALAGPVLYAIQVVTSTNGGSTTTFASSRSYPGSQMFGGNVLCLTATNAANIGVVRACNSGSGTTIGLSSGFPANITIGDTFAMFGFTANPTTDGLHPSTFLGSGSTLYNNTYDAWAATVR